MVARDSNGRQRVPIVRHLLWRMEGPSRIVAARIDVMSRGRELIIYFEPGDEGDVLGRQILSGVFAAARLRSRAARLQRALRDQGWAALHPRTRSGAGRALAAAARWGAVGVAGGLGVVAFARWARDSR